MQPRASPQPMTDANSTSDHAARPLLNDRGALMSADPRVTPAERPMNWWVRGYLLFAAVQGFGIGLTGLLVPAEMQIPLRITPLNARFVAALYVAGGIGVLLAALSRRRAEARLFVVGFGVATLLIFLLTALHW